MKDLMIQEMNLRWFITPPRRRWHRTRHHIYHYFQTLALRLVYLFYRRRSIRAYETRFLGMMLRYAVLNWYIADHLNPNYQRRVFYYKGSVITPHMFLPVDTGYHRLHVYDIDQHTGEVLLFENPRFEECSTRMLEMDAKPVARLHFGRFHTFVLGCLGDTPKSEIGIDSITRRLDDNRLFHRRRNNLLALLHG